MSEYGVDDALEEYGVILAGIDPSPMPALEAVYVYPRDKDVISLETLPAMIIAERVNIRTEFPTKAAGAASDVWMAEIMVYLARGPFVNDDAAMEMERQVRAWRYRRAIGRRLMAYAHLNGKADYIGNGQDSGGIVSGRIGNVHWLNQVFWGVHIEQLVIQHILQEVVY